MTKRPGVPSQQQQLGKMVPPPERIFVGASDYLDTGFAFLDAFKDLCKLEPHETVLDVGCGIGRMAVPLTQYLTPSARYEGFDIVPHGIEWCKERITPAYPNFRFKLVDVFNSAYHPEGIIQAKDFAFPYSDSTFDFVFLTSVFTHMLPDDVTHYLREIRRVLKPTGRCLVTVFIINDESRACIERGTSEVNPTADYGSYQLADEAQPERTVFYDEAFFLDLCRKAGFLLKGPLHYGSWCGRTSYYEYQDIAVLEPA